MLFIMNIKRLVIKVNTVYIKKKKKKKERKKEREKEREREKGGGRKGKRWLWLRRGKGNIVNKKVVEFKEYLSISGLVNPAWE